MLGARGIDELLVRHGLGARRSLGQNFVADPQMIERIVTLARVGGGDHVIEVGPGLGSLTAGLVAAGADVVALEKDRALLPALAEVLADAPQGAVRVVEGDALTVDWSELLAGHDDWVLVANLPYNVAVPIVLSILADAPMVRRALVMVQREVAERLVAGPGGRTVGIPSIKVAWYASARIVATVPPEVFVPRPRVTSALVELERRPPPSDDVAVGDVFGLVDRAYRQRRKMLRSTLGERVDAAAFERAGIDPTERPEQLDVARWAALAGAAAERS